MKSKNKVNKAPQKTAAAPKIDIWQKLDQFFRNKWVIGVMLVIVSFVYNHNYSSMYDKKIDLNGDNIYYYSLGQALSQGEGYTNIISYKNEAGSVVSTYAYDPFGNIIAHTGMDFTYKFSTKPQDELSGMYYYGYRFYQPELGRWINRDPVGEILGSNIYIIVVNNAINKIDILGLLPIYGNWCGPDWTGRYKKPWDKLLPHERRSVAKPIDAVDAACKKHDIAYGKCRESIPKSCKRSREKCFEKADSDLVKAIDDYVTSADGAIEIGLARHGSGLRQHHIMAVRNAIHAQRLERREEIRNMK